MKVFSGSIGVGKTTLLNNLKATCDFPVKIAEELALTNNKIRALMRNTYVYKTITLKEQLNICLFKWDQFRQEADLYNYFDRSLFDPIVFGLIYFEYLKNKEAIQAINDYITNLENNKEFIKSKLEEVIIVTCKWPIVWKRIVKRNREGEVNGDKQLIKKLHEKFPIKMKEICKRFGIKCKVINNDKEMYDG